MRIDKTHPVIPLFILLYLTLLLHICLTDRWWSYSWSYRDKKTFFFKLILETNFLRQIYILEDKYTKWRPKWGQIQTTVDLHVFFLLSWPQYHNIMTQNNVWWYSLVTKCHLISIMPMFRNRKMPSFLAFMTF